jgi:N-acetyl-anhydromuramyl-L-alanine amidase AmpD
MENQDEFLKSIVQLNFPTDRYIQVEYPKNQIVLHHTVSNGSALDVMNYWKTLPTKVGVCMIIERDGTINQLFSSKFYAGHLGLTAKHFEDQGLTYVDLNKTSIAIELISWGGLKVVNGKCFNAYRQEVTNEPVTMLEQEYRGYTAFHSYTPEQIESVKNLLLYWRERYNIPLNYHENMWDVNTDALTGVKGVWTHTSFRFDKSDMFPQNEMVEMLKQVD